MSKKITSVVLALCMAISCLTIGSFNAGARVADASGVSAVKDSETVAAADYGLADNVQDGQILQCFNWSFKGIKNNMQKIAEQGFSAIQTSPIQTIKETTQNRTMKGSWWVYYQPSNFTIETSSQNALGTKADFKEMCDEAHKYGVKVIVDAVLNHMANKIRNDLSDTIPSEIRNDKSLWHDISKDSWYATRYDITQYCMDGVPDLNTGNTKVQDYAKSYLKECIDAGADGFRFDGAKHIETPVDNNCSSQYWPNVLNATTNYAKTSRGITPYYYGEILDKATGNDDQGQGQSVINSYTSMMSVTLSSVSNGIRSSVNSSNADGAKRSDFTLDDKSTVAGNKAVLWNESHDTYQAGTSSYVSDSNINKTWAIIGSRAQACGMYLARPKNFASDQIGTANVTAWGNKEVQAVNQFKNYFIGQSEYLSASGSIAYNERGTEGVVLVNCSGGSQSVNVKANKMKDGTYTDQVSGEKFYVSGGQIKGNIGSTGIAVVYNPKPLGPTASVTPGSKKYNTDTLTLTLNYKNAKSGSYSIDGAAYTDFTDGKTITIGAGLAYGTTTTVSVKATDGTNTSDPVTYTYTKTDPSDVQMVYFDNSSYNWSTVYAYIYKTGGASTIENSPWPGQQMTYNSSTKLYELTVPENLSDGMVIFTESYSATNNRYPADGADGMLLEGKSKLFKANHAWVDYDAPTPTQPTTSVKPTTAPTDKILIGDVDLNSEITIDDATEIQRYLVDMISLSDNARTAADTNADNDIDISDATRIMFYLVGLTDRSGKCGEYVGGVEPTTSEQPTTAEPTTKASTYTMTLTNNYNWSSVYCYYWSDANDKMVTWPGVQMKYSSKNDYNQDIYTVEIPSSANYVIFSNNSGTQTVDIPITGSTRFYISGGSGNSCQVATW